LFLCSSIDDPKCPDLCLTDLSDGENPSEIIVTSIRDDNQTTDFPNLDKISDEVEQAVTP